MAEVFVNKVAESGILSIDLEAYYPKQTIKIFDLKNYLFMGLILKEKDFRAALLTTDWNSFENCNVGITCTADAIIPMWAYMLVASYLEPVASFVTIGNEQKLIESILEKNIAEQINASEFTDKRVVIKGCGDIAIPEVAYVAITNKLRPVVKSIMYGEPCSTVPIYKKKV
jgi:hypothetical protein